MAEIGTPLKKITIEPLEEPLPETVPADPAEIPA